jgi:hypothetical protein
MSEAFDALQKLLAGEGKEQAREGAGVHSEPAQGEGAYRPHHLVGREKRPT